MVLLIIEPNAQKCYNVENEQSSVQKWLAYNMKYYDDVKKYIKQIANDIFKSMFNDYERNKILHLLRRYRLIS